MSVPAPYRRVNHLLKLSLLGIPDDQQVTRGLCDTLMIIAGLLPEHYLCDGICEMDGKKFRKIWSARQEDELLFWGHVGAVELRQHTNLDVVRVVLNNPPSWAMVQKMDGVIEDAIRPPKDRGEGTEDA